MPRKPKDENPIDPMMPDPAGIGQTVIEPEKPKRKSTPKKPSSSLSVAEVMEKLDLTIGAAAAIFGREYKYTASDYQQEAAGIVRMAAKFTIIENVISLFDPFLVVAGIIKKIMTMPKKPGKTKSEPEPEMVFPQTVGFDQSYLGAQ